MDRYWKSKVIMTYGLIQQKSLFQRQYEYYNLILHTSIHCTMFSDLIYTTLNKLNYIYTIVLMKLRVVLCSLS